jgi:hypothetical protein
MGDEDVVRRFHHIVHVGNVQKCSMDNRPNHRQMWAWRANGEDVRRVYELIGSWLGERRKKQYQRMTSERAAYEQMRREFTSPGGKVRYPAGKLP